MPEEHSVTLKRRSPPGGNGSSAERPVRLSLRKQTTPSLKDFQRLWRDCVANKAIPIGVCSVDLSNCSLSDDAIEYFVEWATLHEAFPAQLYLGNNLLTGSCFSHLSRLFQRQLPKHDFICQELDLSCNKIDDPQGFTGFVEAIRISKWYPAEDTKLTCRLTGNPIPVPESFLSVVCVADCLCLPDLANSPQKSYTGSWQSSSQSGSGWNVWRGSEWSGPNGSEYKSCWSRGQFDSANGSASASSYRGDSGWQNNDTGWRSSRAPRSQIVCRHSLKAGGCRMGKDCAFAHPADQLGSWWENSRSAPSRNEWSREGSWWQSGSPVSSQEGSPTFEKFPDSGYESHGWKGSWWGSAGNQSSNTNVPPFPMISNDSSTQIVKTSGSIDAKGSSSSNPSQTFSSWSWSWSSWTDADSSSYKEGGKSSAQQALSENIANTSRAMLTDDPSNQTQGNSSSWNSWYDGDVVEAKDGEAATFSEHVADSTGGSVEELSKTECNDAATTGATTTDSATIGNGAWLRPSAAPSKSANTGPEEWAHADAAPEPLQDPGEWAGGYAHEPLADLHGNHYDLKADEGQYNFKADDHAETQVPDANVKHVHKFEEDFQFASEGSARRPWQGPDDCVCATDTPVGGFGAPIVCWTAPPKAEERNNVIVLGQAQAEERQSQVEEIDEAPANPSTADCFSKWLLTVSSDGAVDQYCQSLEDCFDTVDQVVRLYILPHGQGVDDSFFDDIEVESMEHRELFSSWFRKKAAEDEANDLSQITDAVDWKRTAEVHELAALSVGNEIREFHPAEAIAQVTPASKVDEGQGFTFPEALTQPEARLEAYPTASVISGRSETPLRAGPIISATEAMDAVLRGAPTPIDRAPSPLDAVDRARSPVGCVPWKAPWKAFLSRSGGRARSEPPARR